jgi:hypothetical protein
MITDPIPFTEAISFLLNKEDLPAEWEASDWSEQEPDFRTRAFWSAKVENARFLDRSHGFLFDYLAKVRETIVQPDGTVVTALQIGGREQFVKRIRDFMIAEGMAAPGEFVNVDQKDITDIRSVARLRLIFDTNVRQAYGYGQWKQGMKPAVLRAFPAARLIRERGVKEPRPRHQNNLGEVRLKTDPRWAEFHNARDIGGFGVPWGPYGFQSGVTQEDVSRREARKMGLEIIDVESEVREMPDKSINEGLTASTAKMQPDIKAKLLEELRAKRESRSGSAIERAGEAGRRAGENARREMLSRGLLDAESRGDAAKAAKYKKAISELPDPGLKVRDDGDKIVLETELITGIISVLPDEKSPNNQLKPAMEGIPGNPGRSGQDQSSDAKAAAEAIRAASRNVYPGWTEPKGDSDPGSTSDRAIEAQIAAAVEGRKPLYFEPWGDPDVASRFQAAYRPVIPADVEVKSAGGTLFVYRKEAVRPILDADPEFYRRDGETDFESIVRVSNDSQNGELLGYGARSMIVRPSHEVRLFKGNDLLLYFFVSSPDEPFAASIANERAGDFIRAFGWTDVRFELKRVD